MTKFNGFGHFRFRPNCTLRFRFLFRFRRKSQPKIINLRSGSVSVQSGQTYNHNRDCVVNWSQCENDGRFSVSFWFRTVNAKSFSASFSFTTENVKPVFGRSLVWMLSYCCTCVLYFIAKYKNTCVNKTLLLSLSVQLSFAFLA